MDYNNLDLVVKLEAFDDLICNEPDAYKKETMQDIMDLIEELLDEKISG